jgi:hypothetical protein
LITSVNEANTSELELLRQRIRELEAENVEIPILEERSQSLTLRELNLNAGLPRL